MSKATQIAEYPDVQRESIPIVADSMEALMAVDPAKYNRVDLSAFHAGIPFQNKVEYVWVAGEAKANHDGWSKVNPAHTSTKASANWYLSDGGGEGGDDVDDSGNGCWVRNRPNRIWNVIEAGAEPIPNSDSETPNDCTAAVNSMNLALKSSVFSRDSVQIGTEDELFFPAGVYGLSGSLEAHRFGQVRGAGAVLTDLTEATVTCFAGGGWGAKYSGLKFSGFDVALDLDNENLNSGDIEIEDCVFQKNNKALDLTLQSSIVNIFGCVFKDNIKIATILSDKCTFQNCWFHPEDNTEDDVYTHIDTIGLLIVRDCIGVPGLVKDVSDVEHAWIGMTGPGKVIIRDSRFGGENDPMPLINCDSQYNTSTYISIKDTYCSSAGNQSGTIPAAKKISAVRIMGHYPRNITMKGVISGVDSYLLGFSSSIADISALATTINTSNPYASTPFLSIDAGSAFTPFSQADAEKMGWIATNNNKGLDLKLSSVYDSDDPTRMKFFERKIIAQNNNQTTPYYILLGKKGEGRISGRFTCGHHTNYGSDDIIDVTWHSYADDNIAVSIQKSYSNASYNYDLVECTYDGDVHIAIRQNTAGSNRVSRYVYFTGFVRADELAEVEQYPLLALNGEVSSVGAYSADSTTGEQQNYVSIAKYSGDVEVLGSVTADDYITTSRVESDREGALQALDNISKWKKKDGSIDYEKHYAYKPIIRKDESGAVVEERPGLSMEVRVAFLEKMIYELKTMIES